MKRFDLNAIIALLTYTVFFTSSANAASGYYPSISQFDWNALVYDTIGWQSPSWTIPPSPSSSSGGGGGGGSTWNSSSDNLDGFGIFVSGPKMINTKVIDGGIVTPDAVMVSSKIPSTGSSPDDVESTYGPPTCGTGSTLKYSPPVQHACNFAGSHPINYYKSAPVAKALADAAARGMDDLRAKHLESMNGPTMEPSKFSVEWYQGIRGGVVAGVLMAVMTAANYNAPGCEGFEWKTQNYTCTDGTGKVTKAGILKINPSVPQLSHPVACGNPACWDPLSSGARPSWDNIPPRGTFRLMQM